MSNETGFSLIVVIPCLNESTSIGATIQEVFQFVPTAKIYVVDNNSSLEELNNKAKYMSERILRIFKC